MAFDGPNKLPERVFTKYVQALNQTSLVGFVKTQNPQFSLWVSFAEKEDYSLSARDPKGISNTNIENCSTLRVLSFLLSILLQKRAFDDSVKQKNQNKCSGFPFAEKEGFEPPEV